MIEDVPTATFDGSADAMTREAIEFGTATLHEAAGQVGALPPQIVSMTPGLPLGGWAFPVRCPPGDNLWLHRAIYAAQPNDVLIADVGGGWECGYWGEILSWAARTRGLGGVVLDGGVRDTSLLEEIGLPVFGRGKCIRGTSKRADGVGSLNDRIHLGDVAVDPGDLVIGDEDGVVVLPRADVPDILAKARDRRAKEATMVDRIRGGASTLELMGLAALDGARTSERTSEVGGTR